jgi:hypothetical protein
VSLNTVLPEGLDLLPLARQPRFNLARSLVLQLSLIPSVQWGDITVQTFDDVYKTAGYLADDKAPDAGERRSSLFWGDATATLMGLKAFVELLVTHKVPVERRGDLHNNEEIEEALLGVLDKAGKDVDFVNPRRAGDYHVWPRRACRYLMEHEPSCLPEGVVAFLQSEVPTVAVVEIMQEVDGTGGKKRRSAFEAMDKLSNAELKNLTQKELESRFGVSRSYANEVRTAVLSKRQK